MTTQSMPQVAAVPPPNVRPTRTLFFMSSCPVCDPLWQDAMAHTWDFITKKHLLVLQKMTTVQTLIGVAFTCQWKISQNDVKNAFLNVDINEEVYMKPPPTFAFLMSCIPYESGEVCKLHKALYGHCMLGMGSFPQLLLLLLNLYLAIMIPLNLLKRSSSERILLSIFVDV
ncbi:gag-pol polyprotein [Tanacetum coccineum]